MSGVRLTSGYRQIEPASGSPEFANANRESACKTAKPRTWGEAATSGLLAVAKPIPAERRRRPAVHAGQPCLRRRKPKQRDCGCPVARSVAPRPMHREPDSPHACRPDTGQAYAADGLPGPAECGRLLPRRYSRRFLPHLASTPRSACSGSATGAVAACVVGAAESAGGMTGEAAPDCTLMSICTAPGTGRSA